MGGEGTERAAPCTSPARVAESHRSRSIPCPKRTRAKSCARPASSALDAPHARLRRCPSRAKVPVRAAVSRTAAPRPLAPHRESERPLARRSKATSRLREHLARADRSDRGGSGSIRAVLPFPGGIVSPVVRELDLTIVYEPGEDGWIIASIPEVAGVFSQGQTREEARENILDAQNAEALARATPPMAGGSASRCRPSLHEARLDACTAHDRRLIERRTTQSRAAPRGALGRPRPGEVSRLPQGPDIARGLADLGIPMGAGGLIRRTSLARRRSR